MPPKRRGTQKPKVKHQTYYMPYMFRPIPLSLHPTEIEGDVQLMQALLTSQRAALKRASLAPPAPAEAKAPAPALPATYHPAHATAAAAAPITAYEQSAQLVALLQQQQQAAAAAAAAAAVPTPAAVAPKLASPCTMQHQQAFHHQKQLAGYALA